MPHSKVITEPTSGFSLNIVICQNLRKNHLDKNPPPNSQHGRNYLPNLLNFLFLKIKYFNSKSRVDELMI